jgi:hypothetical protein
MKRKATKAPQSPRPATSATPKAATPIPEPPIPPTLRPGAIVFHDGMDMPGVVIRVAADGHWLMLGVDGELYNESSPPLEQCIAAPGTPLDHAAPAILIAILPHMRGMFGEDKSGAGRPADLPAPAPTIKPYRRPSGKPLDLLAMIERVSRLGFEVSDFTERDDAHMTIRVNGRELQCVDRVLWNEIGLKLDAIEKELCEALSDALMGTLAGQYEGTKPMAPIFDTPAAARKAAAPSTSEAKAA